MGYLAQRVVGTDGPAETRPGPADAVMALAGPASCFMRREARGVSGVVECGVEEVDGEFAGDVGGAGVAQAV
ncbi:hypothetical protein, partial [Streptomyces litmocidini]|uniref:hypothetical protein n=1 Tax=Streptomyces litmocidini TaxID=67318 RepID=UPI0036FE8877